HFEVLFNDGDNFPIRTMLRAQHNRFICEPDMGTPWFFRFFLTESNVIVPSIQNTTDVSNSLVPVELQPSAAGNRNARLSVVERSNNQESRYSKSRPSNLFGFPIHIPTYHFYLRSWCGSAARILYWTVSRKRYDMRCRSAGSIYLCATGVDNQQARASEL